MIKKLVIDIQFYDNMPYKELHEYMMLAIDKVKELEAINIENGRSNVVMAKDYMALEHRCKELEYQLETVSKTLKKYIEDNKLKTSDIYGRSTEKLSDIIETSENKELVDEDTVEDSNVVAIDKNKGKNLQKPNNANSNDKPKGKRPRGKREKDLSNLPSINTYELNIEELNAKYGENNWRIAYWRSQSRVECIPTTVYKSVTYTPVISVGLEHTLCSVPDKNTLIKNSIASPSLASLILYHKFFLALPVYRQELYFKNLGLTLSRQTMNNWVNRLGHEIFSLVYDKMTQLMMQVKYHQCDETFFRVNKDGRAAGSNSFMWVHITSELIKTNPIIIYCFELTRGTDHLRKFYKDFEGYITCDAYISYHILGKENADVIIICGCMMHLRRRFVKSLSLQDISSLEDTEVEDLPETKILRLIGRIYDEDMPLKELSPEKRKEIRDQKVSPLIRELYEYIESIDTTDPLVSNRLKEAIQYANNQKNYITKFLDDGNVPIDDGATERAIRPFTIGRNNWLACDSVEGAETAAIMYSIVETAKANNINVYLYLRYLLEHIPKYLDGSSFEFLDDMLPWSEKYLAYERDQKMSIPNLQMKENQYATRPKTPRKKGESLPRSNFAKSEPA